MNLSRLTALTIASGFWLHEASGSLRPLALDGPRGRVIERGTELPVEGLTVRMTFGAKVLAETITADDGSFALPEPERRRRSVQVLSKQWRISPRRIRLDEDQSSGVTELLFEAERIVSAPLRGRLLDKKTGEPVPDFLFDARGPRGAVESLVTGADGRFASQGGFEAGPMRLLLVDHPSLREEGMRPPDDDFVIEHLHSFDETNVAKDVELRISIGPSYRFQLDLPSGTSAADFYATFPRPNGGLREFHRAIAADPNSPMALYYGQALSSESLEPQAPLRGAEPIWARFQRPLHSVHRMLEADQRRRLHVRSRNGHWSGSAPVKSFQGIASGLVPITLEVRGAVDRTVRNSEDKPVRSAWIQLFTSSHSTNPLYEVGADAEGRFAFQWLDERDYELVVETDRYETWRSAVSIENGSTRQMDVALTSATELGPVSGVLRSTTGQHRSKGGIVTLKGIDQPEFHLFKTARYRERDGEFTASFSFEDVPHGKYELTLDPLDNMRWRTRRMTISAPAEGLEFVCEDDVTTFDLEVRAVDAKTGTPIEESWKILWMGDPLEDARLEDDWESKLFEAVPEGAPLNWVVRAEGYRLATGTETAIKTGTDPRVIEARLERGWGQLFKVTTPGRAPLEGVELLVDGDSVGETDAQGMVSMNLAAKPSALEFRYKDWIVTWGRIDPEKDQFGWGPETPVYMEPEE